MIYVAGPYSARTKREIKANIQAASDAASELVRQYPTATPVVPHLMFQFTGGLGYERIMQMCFETISKCDYIYMMPEWIDSPGAIRELNFAHSRMISRIWLPTEDATAPKVTTPQAEK